MAKQNASSGWDPVLIISQIISIQTLHYVTLAFLIPPLLSLFAEPSSLDYEGGATNVGMIMDWRQMAGRPTSTSSDPWATLNSVWSGGKQVGVDDIETHWLTRIDPRRGWIIAVCWLGASCADIYCLYSLIRRPRLVLDFTLTLLFNHLLLTTYYSAAVPTSLFFWLVMIISAVMIVVVTEQLCVRREMQEGLAVNTGPASRGSEDGNEVEMGTLLRRD
ncbi:hypothetical protein PHLGIDRAFT_74075 [Phlebiopsis gigantea 11061_1 CR5-6]|uniref:Integral membrane protein S linking to the trans Golgi network-domain-containing protein n=1 Tax=Phlebiopsis gigantea (strain 11061_1 CR5-6) TaxID=745531 RepID=A0A0C3S8R3_PHLG1|nr:hypothetical protein PHLGIDRAFT_74075 [Phlebiopsis gigantea 11061_1 CR5-6]